MLSLAVRVLFHVLNQSNFSAVDMDFLAPFQGSYWINFSRRECFSGNRELMLTIQFTSLFLEGIWWCVVDQWIRFSL